jgi:hypothetical protein
MGRAFHPMTTVSRNDKRVTSMQEAGFARFKTQLRYPLKQRHPFVTRLVIPEALRTGCTA